MLGGHILGLNGPQNLLVRTDIQPLVASARSPTHVTRYAHACPREVRNDIPVLVLPAPGRVTSPCLWSYDTQQKRGKEMLSP